MQEIKNAKIIKYKKIFNLKRFLEKIKKLFKSWFVLAIIVAVSVAGYSSFKMVFTGEISSVVNFNFDGIESGIDPRGNKFDVSEIKSLEIITGAIEELQYENLNPELIQKNITVESIVPGNAIDHIVSYSPLIENDEFSDIKNIKDTSYYPTQYQISLKCEDIGISKKEAANLLNKITEKYNKYFYKAYGYNTFVESAVTSVDYKSYDYIDAIDVFKVSLKSLQKYINELSDKDTNRFKSENGYTFADISASIDTICYENIDQTMAYIQQYNVSKDKKILIAKYRYNIEEDERKKASAEEIIETINNTLEEYKKSSVMIMGNAGESVGSSVNKTTGSYDYLLQQKLSAQTVLSKCEQEIKLYNERIKSLESSREKSNDVENVEKQLEQISDKINTLLEITNETASEYYEKDLLNNAFTVLTPANPSTYAMVKSAITDSKKMIISYELIILSIYFGISFLLCFVKLPGKSKSKNAEAGKKQKRK